MSSRLSTGSRQQPGFSACGQSRPLYTFTLYTFSGRGLSKRPKSWNLRQQGRMQPATGSQEASNGNAAAAMALPHSWTKRMSETYLIQGRDWQAVEDLYVRLVAGQDCLSVIGLSPAGQPAAGLLPDQQQQQQQPLTPVPHLQQQQQQQQTASNSLALHEQPPMRTQQHRVTYKLQVSYLGSSFSGWQGGQQEDSKPGAHGTLARAIAATGLCELPAGGASKSKRLAKRAVRKAYATQLAAAAAVAAAAAAAVAAADQAAAADETEQAAASNLQQLSGEAVSQVPGAAAQQADVTEQPPSVTVPFLNCSGRTDAGVSAAGQVVDFFSWQRPPVPAAQLVTMINTQLELQWAAVSGVCDSPLSAANAAAGTVDGAGVGAEHQQQQPLCPVRVWHAEQVPRQFHATYHATWRRYVYLLPLRTPHTGSAGLSRTPSQDVLQLPELTPEQQQAVQAAPDVDPALVNAMLQHLQGRRLNFFAFARDTPQNKDCECTLLVARASLVWLHSAASKQQQQQQGRQGAEAACPCMAVELVADRFLRRMVRVLVGTAVREAVAAKQQQRQRQQQRQQGAAGDCMQQQQQLLQLVQSMDRNATAGPAPALGLCFAGVGYAECKGEAWYCAIIQRAKSPL